MRSLLAAVVAPVVVVAACTSNGSTAEPPPRLTTSTYADTAAPCDPAAGHVESGVVEIVLEADVPSPRCVRPRSDERLRVVNGTSMEAVVSLSGRRAVIPPGRSHTFPDRIGQWLKAGNTCLDTTSGCVEIYVD